MNVGKVLQNPRAVSKNGILALDPGVEWGWAYFPVNDYKPLACGICSPKSSLPWNSRIENGFAVLSSVLKRFEPWKVYCEEPQFFADVGGYAAAAGGTLVKLTAAYGVLWGACLAMGVKFQGVPVNKWKGQLPKEVVIRRSREILGEKFCLHFLQRVQSHAWDAIGLGLWARGKFNA